MSPRKGEASNHKGYKISELNPKQRKFVEYYCNPKSETFGNSYKSYVKAGYKNTPVAKYTASQLLNNPKVIKEIERYTSNNPQELIKKSEISKDYARQQLIEALDAAKEAGDLTNRVACVRLLLQITGQLSDKLVVDVRGALQLEEHKRQEAKRIASIILENHYLPPAITEPLSKDTQNSTQDVECEVLQQDDNDNDNTTDDYNSFEFNDLQQ